MRKQCECGNKNENLLELGKKVNRIRHLSKVFLEQKVLKVHPVFGWLFLAAWTNYAAMIHKFLFSKMLHITSDLKNPLLVTKFVKCKCAIVTSCCLIRIFSFFSLRLALLLCRERFNKLLKLIKFFPWFFKFSKESFFFFFISRKLWSNFLT
jgi:hypothetical protein